MHEQKDDFERAGASLVAVGQGTGRQAAEYAAKWDVTLPILGDVKGKAYQDYGMLRGSWWQVMGRSMLMDPVESFRLILQADWKASVLPASDVMRLPGTAIVAKGGRLRFLHKGEEPGDNTSNAEMLDALGRL